LLAHDEALPADVRVRRLHRADELLERDALPAQAERIDADVELLRLAAEAHDVDDAADLLELALEDPVLGRLEVARRGAVADDLTAKGLADRVPRRDLRLHALRQSHELQAVDGLLPRLLVRRPPLEVALHVAQPEEGLRARVLEPRHPREADFQRDRDVA